jgi:hypothetical protein
MVDTIYQYVFHLQLLRSILFDIFGSSWATSSLKVFRKRSSVYRGRCLSHTLSESRYVVSCDLLSPI